MLFFKKYKDKDEVEKLPKNYLVIDLTKRKSIIPHPSIKNVPILPEIDSKDIQEQFEYELVSKYREHITILANYLVKSSPANSLVIVAENKLCKKAGFNIPKVICETIEKRYKYPYFKFTYDITTDMLKESKFTKKGLTNLIKDMNSLRKDIHV